MEYDGKADRCGRKQTLLENARPPKTSDANNAMLWVSGAGNIGKHWSNRNGMEVANAGFSISPPLYYPLAQSWEGRARLYYTPLSINARLSANFSWLSYFDCLCATRAVSEPVLTRGPDFSLPFFFFLLLWTRMCSRDTDDITKLARESCIRSQTGEVSIVFFEW